MQRKRNQTVIYIKKVIYITTIFLISAKLNLKPCFEQHKCE